MVDAGNDGIGVGKVEQLPLRGRVGLHSASTFMGPPRFTRSVNGTRYPLWLSNPHAP